KPPPASGCQPSAAQSTTFSTERRGGPLPSGGQPAPATKGCGATGRSSGSSRSPAGSSHSDHREPAASSTPTGPPPSPTAPPRGGARTEDDVCFRSSPNSDRAQTQGADPARQDPPAPHTGRSSRDRAPCPTVANGPARAGTDRISGRRSVSCPAALAG